MKVDVTGTAPDMEVIREVTSVAEEEATGKSPGVDDTTEDGVEVATFVEDVEEGSTEEGTGVVGGNCTTIVTEES